MSYQTYSAKPRGNGHAKAHQEQILRLQSPLAVTAFLEPAQERLAQELARFHVRVTLPSFGDGPPACESCSVALIQASLLGAPQIFQVLNSRATVVLLVNQGSDPQPEAIEDRMDGIASLGVSAAELATVLRIAHRNAANKRELCDKILALEAKIEQTKLIGQAKAIIAEQLGISEAAALQHLRLEARNRRRPLYELANVVLEARRIIQPEPRGKAAGQKLRT
jgi:hypothetical protein